jgi:hypothetical protein
VHRDPADVAVAQLDLAAVQPGADLHVDAAQLLPERCRLSSDGAGWCLRAGYRTVEAGGSIAGPPRLCYKSGP